MGQLVIKIGADVAAAVAGVKQLDAGVSKLGNNIETLRAKALAKQQFLLVEKDIGNVASLNREISQLQGEIARVSKVGSTGFGEIGGGATKVLSSVRSLAYILPGIGMAGIFNLAFEAIGKVADALSGTKDVLLADKFAAEDFANSLKDIESAAKRIGEALDFSKKITALKNDLKFGQAPGANLHADLATQVSSIDQNKAAIASLDIELNKVNQSFKEAGDEAKAAFEKIKNFSGFDLAKLSESEKFLIAVKGDLSKLSDEQLKGFSKGQQLIIDRYRESSKTLDALQKQRTALTQENAVLENTIPITQAKIAEENEKLRLAALRKTLEEQRKMIEEAKRIQNELGENFQINRITGLDDFAAQLEKAKVIIDTFKSAKVNAPVENPGFTIRGVRIGVENAIESALVGFTAHIPLVKLEIEKFVIPQGNDLKNPLLRFGGTIPLKLALDIDDKAKAELQKQLGSLNEAISAGLADMAAAFGEGIGNLISGTGNIGDIFDAIFSSIGASLAQLGKLMIVHATAIKAFKKAFDNPAAELAAGITLVIVGTAIQKSLQHRASGGPVEPGQPYMVGEVGREMFVPNVPGRIVPNNQLGAIGGGFAVTVAISGRLRNRDIILGNSREMRAQRINS